MVLGPQESMTVLIEKVTDPIAVKVEHLPRIAVVCDLLEENWPSMDLVSEMLLKNLDNDYSSVVQAGKICPQFVPRFTRLPLFGSNSVAQNADRLLNRMHYYPRHLASRLEEFDLFHICDHSYSQLIHVLPGRRTGVFCHDLDTFRCLIEPNKEPRPRWFKAMAGKILSGLQKAAIVFYTTDTVRKQIERYGLLDPNVLVKAPYGVSPEFTSESVGLDPAAAILVELQGAPFLLHVGSCIARKRIDLLLDAFAGARLEHRDLKLLQVGGEWSIQQLEQIKRLGIGAAVLQLQRQDRPTLAGLYRHASVVLAPSEAEGFGLPIIEALACGATVVASDIPVFHEVGGDDIFYCPLDDVQSWVDTTVGILTGFHPKTSLGTSFDRRQRFSWEAHTRTIVEAYQRLL
jgi:glycosyltransferase involved in cell wall biosynthesis